MDLYSLTIGTGLTTGILAIYVFFTGAKYEEHLSKHAVWNSCCPQNLENVDCPLLEKYRIRFQNSFNYLLIFLGLFFTLLLIRLFQLERMVFYEFFAQIALGIFLVSALALWLLRKNYRYFKTEKPDTEDKKKALEDKIKSNLRNTRLAKISRNIFGLCFFVCLVLRLLS